VFAVGGFPEGFDWRAYDQQKLQRRRAIEVRRRMLQSYLPALSRIAGGGASPFPVDQQLVMECVRLVFDTVVEDVRDVAELQHRHMAAKPPEPPPGESAPPPPAEPPPAP
jgi:hypothetical protein